MTTRSLTQQEQTDLATIIQQRFGIAGANVAEAVYTQEIDTVEVVVTVNVLLGRHQDTNPDGSGKVDPETGQPIWVEHREDRSWCFYVQGWQAFRGRSLPLTEYPLDRYWENKTPEEATALRAFYQI